MTFLHLPLTSLKSLSRLLPLLIVLTPVLASAYCRTTTCELNPETMQNCAKDAKGCSAEGAYLTWKDPCLSYALDSTGAESLGVSLATYEKSVIDAFARWKDVECPEGGHPRFEAAFRGFQDCQASGTVCGDQHQNTSVLMVQTSGWPMNYPQRAIGLTIVSADLDSGEIIDADLELNASSFSLTWDSEDSVDPSAHRADMVLTHELGHFLGLSHSQVSGSIMAENYQNLASANISADDIAAICAVFPPSSEPLSCGAPEPAASSCDTSEAATSCNNIGSSKQSGGCSLAGAPRSSGTLWGLFTLALGLSLRRRRYCHDSQQARGVDASPNTRPSAMPL